MKLYKKVKRRVFDYLEPIPNDPIGEKIFNFFIVFLILINVVAVSLETVDSINNKYGNIINIIEDVSIIIFTIEYGLRLWVCNIKEKFKTKYGRIKYVFTFSALVDLASILPFFIIAVPGVHLASIRFLRLLSFIRFFKLGRYSNSFKLLDDVYRKKKDLLVASMGLSVFLIIASAFFIYMVEHEAQPDKYSSIPQRQQDMVIFIQ